MTPGGGAGRVTAAGLRVYLAATVSYIHDEENTVIPLAQSISFSPDSLNLPLRAVNHPALPGYFVKLSSMVFGTTPLGLRTVHVLAGLCIVALIYRFTNQVYGPVAARWAAALIAFNEYFLAASSRATAHVPYLLFVAMALYAFSRFLVDRRAAYLYVSAASVGLAFYSKEHAALLLPVFFATLLLPDYRRWLGSRHVYLACAAFVVVIAPDVLWNLAGSASTEQATYGSHLQRLGGVAFSPYPAMFYARDPVRAIYLLLTGEVLDDNTPEYASMNTGLGVLLLGAVLVTAVRAWRQEPLRRYLLVLFWGIFGFFALLRPGNPDGLDPVSWIWVDVTMFPAAILAGVRLAGVGGNARIAAWAFAGAALLYAGVQMVA